MFLISSRKFFSRNCSIVTGKRRNHDLQKKKNSIGRCLKANLSTILLYICPKHNQHVHSMSNIVFVVYCSWVTEMSSKIMNRRSPLLIICHFIAVCLIYKHIFINIISSIPSFVSIFNVSSHHNIQILTNNRQILNANFSKLKWNRIENK